MARYKVVDRSPRFLPIVLEAQLMAGSFEYAVAAVDGQAQIIVAAQAHGSGSEQSVPCRLRNQCLRYPERTQTRQVAFCWCIMDTEHRKNREQDATQDVGPPMNPEITQISMSPFLVRTRSPQNRVFLQLR